MPILQNSVQPVQKGKIFWTAQMPCGCCYVQLVQFVQGNKTSTINAPAFCPSRPRVCRKRRKASRLNPTDRYAGLDPSRLTSGQKNSRAKDGNPSGGGSEQKYPREQKGTKTRPRFALHSSFWFSRFHPIADRGLPPIFDHATFCCRPGGASVLGRHLPRFRSGDAPFCVRIFPVSGQYVPRFPAQARAFFDRQLQRFSDSGAVLFCPLQRFHPSALAFFSDRLSVLQVPRFILAGWELADANSHPAKGLAALWTPRQGCSAQASRIPKEKT